MKAYGLFKGRTYVREWGGAPLIDTNKRRLAQHKNEGEKIHQLRIERVDKLDSNNFETGWNRLNRRRLRLIALKQQRKLTGREIEEFKQLQVIAGLIRNYYQ